MTPLPRPLSASGGISSIEPTLGASALVTFTDAVPFVFTPSAGSHKFTINSATEVSLSGAGTLDGFVLSCTAATVVDLTGLTVAEFTLTVGNPTLTDPDAVTGGYTFISASKTTLAIPADVVDMDVQAANMATLTVTTLANCVEFTCMGAKLDSESVEALLSAIAGNALPAIVDISGGTSAAPVLDNPATGGTGSITCPAGAALNLIGAASWVSPQWKTTQRYFWFDNGVTTDPGATGTPVAVAFDGTETSDELATLLEAAMESNGYSSSVSTNEVSYTLDETGSSNTFGTQDGGNNFSFNGETQGQDANNLAVSLITGNGGTVTHN